MAEMHTIPPRTDWQKLIIYLNTKPIGKVLTRHSIVQDMSANMNISLFANYIYKLTHLKYMSNPEYGMYARERDIPLDITIAGVKINEA